MIIQKFIITNTQQLRSSVHNRLVQSHFVAMDAFDNDICKRFSLKLPVNVSLNFSMLLFATKSNSTRRKFFQIVITKHRYKTKELAILMANTYDRTCNLSCHQNLYHKIPPQDQNFQQKAKSNTEITNSCTITKIFIIL